MMEDRSIFIFGGTGFVGRNLLATLQHRDCVVTCFVRDSRGAEFVRGLGARAVVGEILKPETYRLELAPGSTVVYLIHTMGLQRLIGDLADLDRKAVEVMLQSSRQAGVARIIHLSGLYDPREKLSRHLASRAEVSRLILDSRLPATVLRASIIFGSGSASYEILRAALKFPVVPLPPWRNVRVQPIVIDDVVRCLVALLKSDFNRGAGRVLDIGGPEVFTYGELLKKFAVSLGLKRKFINLPFEARPIAALLLAKLSGIGVGETSALLESLNNTSVVQGENAIQTVFGFQPTPVFHRG